MFTEFVLGKLRLPNRVVMAPMTRSRVGVGNTPTALNAKHYAQRASSGLIISEAIVIAPQARGYLSTPGLYSPAQVFGWTHVVNKVHQAKGRIVAQLWHAGRVSHQSVLPAGCVPLSATDQHVDNLETFGLAADGRPGTVGVTAPRAMALADIDMAVAQFAQAAVNARRAGFDGIEILASDGYLIEQFLNAINNTRSDSYGGQTPENRCRFLLDVLDAVTATLKGQLPIIVRLSPYSVFNGMPADPLAEETYLYLATQLRNRRIDCVHLHDQPVSIGHLKDDNADASSKTLSRLIPAAFVSRFKALYAGPLILCGALDGKTANQFLARGDINLVAFGVPFIGNPDLPERLQNNWPLTTADPKLFFGGAEKGYIDYPRYA